MPASKRPTARTCQRCIRGTYVHHLYPLLLCFVFHKVLQLSPRPSMQPCSHPFIPLNSFSDIFQILQNDRFASRGNSLLYKSFTHFVIRFFNASLLFTRGFFQTALCRFRTVGLKFFASIQKRISFVPTFSTSIDCTIRRCGDIIFSQIYSQNRAFRFQVAIREIEDNVQKPSLSFSYQFRFFHFPLTKIMGLMVSHAEATIDSSSYGKQRKLPFFKRKGTSAIMDAACLLKHDMWDFFRFPYFKNLVARTNFSKSIAYQLCSQLRHLLSDRVIAQVVQRDTVPTPIIFCKGDDHITRFGESLLCLYKGFRLLLGKIEFEGYCPFHSRYRKEKDKKRQNKERHFLPYLKEGVSMPKMR